MSAETAIPETPVTDAQLDSTFDAGPTAQATEAPQPTHPETESLGDATASMLADGDAPDSDAGDAANSGEQANADATAQPVESAPADDFDAQLLADAEWYGFRPEEAKSFGSPAALRRAMTAIDRRELSAARGGEKRQTGANQSQARETSAPANQDATQTAAGQTAAPTIEAYKLDLDPSQFDEDSRPVIAGLQGLVEFANKQHASHATALAQAQATIQQLTERLERTEQFHASVQNERFTHDLDRLFDSVAEQYGELFGKGPIKDLKDLNQVKQRNDVVNELLGLQDIDHRNGREPMPLDRVFRRAISSLHPDKTIDLARKQVAKEVTQHRSGAVARPNQRRSAPLSADQEAVEAAREAFKAAGLDPGPRLLTPAFGD